MTLEDYRLLEGAATCLRVAIPALRRAVDHDMLEYDALYAIETSYQAVSQITRSTRNAARAIVEGGETPCKESHF